MIYIYTQADCPKCILAKEAFKKANTLYIEREASRLKNPEDVVDTEGLIQASIQNMILPVVIDYV